MAKQIKVKDDDMILVLSAFTKGGAWVLMKRYIGMGAKVVEEPMLRDDTMWVFMVSNPFMDRA